MAVVMLMICQGTLVMDILITFTTTPNYTELVALTIVQCTSCMKQSSILLGIIRISKQRNLPEFLGKRLLINHADGFQVTLIKVGARDLPLLVLL